jgi:hypothetical protein
MHVHTCTTIPCGAKRACALSFPPPHPFVACLTLNDTQPHSESPSQARGAQIACDSLRSTMGRETFHREGWGKLQVGSAHYTFFPLSHTHPYARLRLSSPTIQNPNLIDLAETVVTQQSTARHITHDVGSGHVCVIMRWTQPATPAAQLPATPGRWGVSTPPGRCAKGSRATYAWFVGAPHVAAAAHSNTPYGNTSPDSMGTDRTVATVVHRPRTPPGPPLAAYDALCRASLAHAHALGTQ